MSGFEKFQNTEEWRQKVREHLLMDRPLKKPSKIEVNMDSQEKRYSLDIVEDFRALMEQKKAELKQRQVEEEAEEAAKAATTVSICEESVYQVLDQSFADQDDSFATYERMCDKTSSDPDSTLFQYLHSDDKEHVLAMAKERSGIRNSNTHDVEVDALRRMFEEFDAQEQLDNESPIKGVERTQLEDVEAPSRFWDNTIIGNDSILMPSAKTSPVKMVGLMRPSTILEANEADLTTASSNASSLASYHSAQKTETIASSCYETAAESSKEENQDFINVDSLFYAAIAKVKPPRMSKGEEEELLLDLQSSLLEMAAPKQTTLGEAELENDTVIELSSDDEAEPKSLHDVDIKAEKLSMAAANKEDNKENEREASLHFNDTMEEMEYMMQKGLEYMAAAAAKPPLVKQNTFILSPKAGPTTPLANSNKTPLAVPMTGSVKKKPARLPARFDLNMCPKPTPKFFKQPSAIPHRRQLDLKENYAHIVSPIRAYTHKSGTVPLMTTSKHTGRNDLFKSSAVAELEQEARLCRTNESKGRHIDLSSTAALLPKKAYISSDVKQFVDERTPMPMPAVSQIQKYLDSAMEPTVLRHDGKMNSAAANVSHIPRRNNQSFADLSLAYGDISMYTVKDAQKF